MSNIKYMAYNGEPKTADREGIAETQQVFLGDECIGEIHRREEALPSSRFHAAIHIGEWATPECGLAQGFGTTREEAIANAFDRSREKTQNYLRRLDALDQRIRGEKQ